MFHRSKLYTLAGTLLFSAGIVLGSTLGISLLRQRVDAAVAHAPDYLVLQHMPIVPLPAVPWTPTSTPTLYPSATPTNLPPTTVAQLITVQPTALSTATVLPTPVSTGTPTSTPIPTATAYPTATPIPPLQPATRIEIPRIGLNTNIVESQPQQITNAFGAVEWHWESVEYAVGHHSLSGVPGAGTNIVLSGHNNWRGEVFRDLPELVAGDTVILYTADDEYRYRVVEKTIVPYRADPEAGEAVLQSYAQASDHERVTLVSCYPYVTNVDRIVVVAVLE